MPGENGSEAHSPERLPACAAAERPGRATTARRVHGLTPLGIGASRESALAEPERGSIEQAVLRTVAYADVFDHPLTVPEAHRYLVGVAAPAASVHAALER